MNAPGEYDMTDLLMLLVTEHAESLRVIPRHAPTVHLLGEPHPILGPAVSPEHAESLFRSVADTRQMRELRSRGTAEFVFTFRDSVRFRVEARMQHDEVQFQIHAIAA